MTLTPIRSHESARKNFFMNLTYFMSRKWQSFVFGLRRPKDSNTHQFPRTGEKTNFHELDVHHV